MKGIILLSIIFSFITCCYAGNPDYDRFKVGVNVSLQNVIDYNSESRWTDIHYHKVSFFGLGLMGSQRIDNFDFHLGVSIHEETLDNFSDQSIPGTLYYTLRSTHLTIPLGVDWKMSKREDRYLFTRFTFNLDYIFNATKIQGLSRIEESEMSFYRDYLEFGVGYNTLIKSNYGFRALLSYFPMPLWQGEKFGETVTFTKFGISVGAYKSFK